MRFLLNKGKSRGFSEKVWEEWIEQVEKNQDGEVRYKEKFLLKTFFVDKVGRI